MRNLRKSEAESMSQDNPYRPPAIRKKAHTGWWRTVQKMPLSRILKAVVANGLTFMVGGFFLFVVAVSILTRVWQFLTGAGTPLWEW